MAKNAHDLNERGATVDGGAVPLYRAIVEALRDEIMEGRILSAPVRIRREVRTIG